MWREIARDYREGITGKDNFWIRRVTRPFSAVVVYFLKDTRITPNQISFLSVACAVVGALVLIFRRSYPGLLTGVAVFQIAFILDCADGQLARLRGADNDLGMYVDFLTDELRAYIFFGSVALRLFLQSDRIYFLVIGITGMFLLAAGISLTTFIRRREYGGSGGREEAAAKGIAAVAYGVGKFVIHYPSYVVYLAVINRIEIYFFFYTAACAVHVCRTGLSVVLKVCRLRKKG